MSSSPGLVHHLNCTQTRVEILKVHYSEMFVVFCRSQKRGQPLTIPASNGQVERFNRTLLQMIRCYVNQNQKNWDEHLPLLTSAYRSPSMQLLDSHQIGSCLEGKFTNLRICGSVWQSKGHTVWKCQISCTTWKRIERRT